MLRKEKHNKKNRWWLHIHFTTKPCTPDANRSINKNLSFAKSILKFKALIV